VRKCDVKKKVHSEHNPKGFIWNNYGSNPGVNDASPWCLNDDNLRSAQELIQFMTADSGWEACSFIEPLQIFVVLEQSSLKGERVFLPIKN
jgi:hypothetical protein